MSGNIIRDLETRVEDEIFSPRPGGMVDTFRKREAALRAAEAEQQNTDQPVQERAYRAVKVALESPEVLSAQTITIQPGQFAMVLPQNPMRYRATVKFVSNGSAQANAVVARDSSAALGRNGYMLSYGETLVTHTRAAVYVFNADTAAISVSVLAELYASQVSGDS